MVPNGTVFSYVRNLLVSAPAVHPSCSGAGSQSERTINRAVHKESSALLPGRDYAIAGSWIPIEKQGLGGGRRVWKLGFLGGVSLVFILKG